ncbi:hypothetical protein [Embleya sp. NPDC020630]|uniref:hypothetical protein n=1 Tax=Embleya sp. NPDC020630 TaxID=3363979 RepID=UPI0037BA11E3
MYEQRELVQGECGAHPEQPGEYLPQCAARFVGEFERARDQHQEDPVDLVVHVHLAHHHVPERALARPDQPSDQPGHREGEDERDEHPADAVGPGLCVARQPSGGRDPALVLHSPSLLVISV